MKLEIEFVNLEFTGLTTANDGEILDAPSPQHSNSTDSGVLGRAVEDSTAGHVLLPEKVEAKAQARSL